MFLRYFQKKKKIESLFRQNLSSLLFGIYEDLCPFFPGQIIARKSSVPDMQDSRR